MIFDKNIKSLQFGFGQNRPGGLEIFWEKKKFIVYKNIIGKMAIFRPKHGLTPLQKSQFIDFLNFLFL